ncbi:MAG TPA: glycoside hydrolase family 2 protein, partial [Chloroflexia bacterium]|nr:glycoside hydrolase family 2 protein [Chloroflexia bacterium]
MQTQDLTGDWQFRQRGTDDWWPARVPGGVHTDLLALGRIPDPFAGDNEKHVQWVAESDWEYRYRFRVRAAVRATDQVWLVCDGLDTLATLSLDGRPLGQTENMFRSYRWDVTALLHAPDSSDTAGSHELRIAFASPVQFAAAQQAVRSLPGVSQAIPGGPYLRKAP